MLKFNRLEPMKLYRVKDKFALPCVGSKTIGRDNLIAVYGESINDTVEFFQRPYIRFRGYKKYYIERILKFQLLAKRINIINDQQDIFYNGFGLKYPQIRLSKNPGNVSNFNVVYEMGQYMDIIMHDDKINMKNLMVRYELKFNYLIKRLKECSELFPSHPKKYLCIPLDKYLDNPRNTAVWNKRINLDNPMIGFLKMMESRPEVFRKDLAGWTLIFLNVNELFYVDCDKITSSTYMDIRGILKKTRSRRGLVCEEPTDPSLEVDSESEDVDTDDDIVTVNTKIAAEVIEDASEDIDDIKLSKDTKNKIKSKIADKVYDAKAIAETDKNEAEELNIATIKKPLSITKSAAAKPVSTIDKLSTTVISKDKEEEEEPVTNTVKQIPKEELKKEVEKEIKKSVIDSLAPNASPTRLARLKKIQEEQDKIMLENKTLEEIKAEANAKVIEDKEYKADVINPNVKNIKFDNFDKGYCEKLMEPDLIKILTKFSTMDRPLFLISLNKEDTSTSMDKKYTYTAIYEDEHGGRHTLKFDYPKLVNNKYIRINNSDKLFLNQILPLPVTKTSPDQVQVSSNYKKIFISRFGANISSKSVKFNKIIPDIDNRILDIDYGNNGKINIPYMTTMEYDDIAKKYSKFKFKNQDITLYFNQEDIRKVYNEKGIKFKDEELPFGINEKTNTPILIDTATDTIVGSGISTVDYIIELLSNDVKDISSLMNKTSSSKRLMYTRAKIMAKQVPLVLLLSFLVGLEPLLNKLKIRYAFSETRPSNLKVSDVVIKFADGYLIYDGSKFSTALILNGLIAVPTEGYNFLQFAGKEIYYDIFFKLYGRRNIGNAFENFQQIFIDPITEEVLTDCKLPTNFVDLLIYANSLLENNTYDFDGNMNNYRVRSIESINAHLYNILATAYEGYRSTADNKSPQKFSIKQDELFKSIFSSQIVEEASTLNPILEMERMRATSYKGLGGCNLDRAFKKEKRAYNDTMLGVLAQSSPVASNIGIARVLSLDPNIKSLRGYIDAGSTDKMNELELTNMMSSAELLSPLTATHDDPQRVAMTSTQSKHTIGTVHSDVPLFGYGYDRVLAQTISDKFAFKAKGDGVIHEVNEKLGYMIIKYYDGQSEVVDLTSRQGFNTGSGFFVTNKLTPNMKEGDKVTQGKIVASNRDFFEYNELTGDTVYKSGPLARVAVMHSSSLFEDSTIVTESFADKLASYVTESKNLLLGKNSNIYQMVKVGDKVNVNDPLIIYDESYQDDYLNKLLAKMSENEKEDIVDSGRTKILSKWNGEVIDIKIYYTVPKTEMSETLAEVITDYEKDQKKRLKAFKESGINIKDMISLNDPTGVTEMDSNGKVEGLKMGDKHVIVKFFVRTEDRFTSGDKCTFGIALKGVNQTLIPRGMEPYLASDPSIKIDAFMSVSGYYSRMTNSFSISMAMNSTLLASEKKIGDMLKSGNTSEKRKNITEFIVKLFDGLESGGTKNSTKFTNQMKSLSDSQFIAYMTSLVNDPNKHLYFEIEAFVNEPSYAVVEKVANEVVGDEYVHLYDYIAFPHLSENPKKPVYTVHKIYNGYVNMRRVQQIVNHKNHIPTHVDKRDPKTGQVSFESKAVRCSDVEQFALISQGNEGILKEFFGPRGGDSVMRDEMSQQIATSGSCALAEMHDSKLNKPALNTANVYLIGAALENDLITKNGVLPRTVLRANSDPRVLDRSEVK